MLVGTPLFAVLYSIIRDAVNLMLHRRSLPQEAWRYQDVSTLEAGSPLESAPGDGGLQKKD